MVPQRSPQRLQERLMQFAVVGHVGAEDHVRPEALGVTLAPVQHAQLRAALHAYVATNSDGFITQKDDLTNEFINI